MIDYIKGNVTTIYDTAVALECGGIGYCISVSSNTIQNLSEGEQKLFVRMQVREDGITLYGFSSNREREVFDKLITVQKVGPKAAMNLLCALTPEQIIMAIMAQDHKTLTRANGVGSKMAEQIVVALKRSFTQDALIGQDAPGMLGEESFGADAKKRTEAVIALNALGFDSVQANEALSGIDDQTLTLEEMIKAALQRLAQ